MKDQDWDIIISPDTSKGTFQLKELLRYKDLILLFVKRDFISLYKQTILGPLWVVIQPVLTTITFYVVFNKIAKIETGVDPLLFYMLGVTTWTYFADCINKTSETFIANQSIFGKVYFPRLATPISLVITNLIKFAIQFALFLLIYLVFFFVTEQDLSPNLYLLLIPFLILCMAALGLGVGLIIASMTIKYRDLRFLIQFGIQLAMYITPVVYPLNAINAESRWVLQLNPMTNIIESFKVGFFGLDYGVMDFPFLAYSFVFAFCILWIGMKVFGRVERTFMDSI
ncbi:ABC transporter permease [Paracrocinitomix mangrovi]|uniref:ABC transporter permease n=1 Tax=Paracrocinitomix mangrovi TaxID=2862509 RepID=UPI001C8E5E78|nr:ABC transporter permease [Paracrocinitomix mangrovi]UKN01559.1 ABC transporter permease [Paracrocinitomix mangrovi]